MSTEAAQIRYAVCAQDLVGAISSTTLHPFEARQQKPKINCIGWVSELVRIARNANAFAELAEYTEAKRCPIVDPAEMVQRAPDIIIDSRHGKKVRHETLRGISAILAVRHGMVPETTSPGMLCPRPIAMRGGLPQVAQRIQRSQASEAGHS